MPIKEGERLPDVTFRTMTAEGPQPLTTAEVFAARRSCCSPCREPSRPTCSNNHLPGYIQHRDAILAKGVDTIAVTAVNDAFVMNAWAEAKGAKDKIVFLADGNGDFAKAIGLDLDGREFGLGIRTKRYSMIVKDGVLQKLAIEETPRSAAVSGAEAMLGML